MFCEENSDYLIMLDVTVAMETGLENSPMDSVAKFLTTSPC